MTRSRYSKRRRISRNGNGALDGRYRGLQPFKLARQTIRREALRVQLLAGWLERADHDRVSAEALDLLLGFDANAFADGQQPNNAGHPDEDTEQAIRN